ncbi:4-hydroxythreonine-4-phosphate dehydrogenase [Deltaproteobacteria bacterium]|nr:4-hydroxythreonine-4-phosphate dehydrogenase [Deltaproteobacteria bacterium]
MTVAPIAITPGCPKGIGYEVTAMAVRRLGLGPVVIAGDHRAMQRAGLRESDRVELLETGDTGEPAEVAALRWAVLACRTGRARALCTGPIHKARLAAQGFAYHGHTDFLADLCGVSTPVMAFVGGSVRVALVTVHHSLRAVPDLITRERVLTTLRVVDRALRSQLRLEAPRIAVCGLNPHAGEGGLLGREELEAIGPAIEAAKAEGILAFGPVSAEEAFMHPERCDLVLAMYHDQGLAPLKRVDFGRTVNWTMGLPIVRTSVDHGTADALVGTGLARSESMEAALKLADELSRGSCTA